MEATKSEVQALIRRERDRLVGVLGSLPASAWASPTLCAGWSVRDLTAHLLMPYEISALPMLGKLARRRFRFDQVADEWARQDSRTPEQLLEALNGIDDKRFGPPGVPQVAALSHLVTHGPDIFLPLGIENTVHPTVGVIVLDELVRRGRRSLPDGILDGRRFAATDLPWRYGSGEQVSGPAAALIPTLLGRKAALSNLHGDGMPGIRDLISGEL